MTPGGRASAAIEVLTEVLERGRPAGEALQHWGRAHRFAGSSDRAAIGNLVYAALRRKASLASAMGDDSPRSLVVGALRWNWNHSLEALEKEFDGEAFSPPPLSEQERAALAGDGVPEAAPDHVRADVPEWLWPRFVAAFGMRAVAEGQGLAGRPPVDIRINTLKTSRDKLARQLARHSPEPTRYSPVGLRFATPEGPKRNPNVEAEPAHARGAFEVQDEGSQLAALLAGARPGQQVVDYCAGAGGKTLALAAQMAGKGQVHAFDADRRRLKPLVERMRRAGAHNIQVRDSGTGPDGGDGLDDLERRADVVLVDAPCTGSGTWRRRPEAKWRLRAEAIEARRAEQAAILDRAARLVKPGGRLVYVTCSVFPAENGEAVSAFRAAHPGFEPVPCRDIWDATIGTDAPPSADGAAETLLLTPASHGTDGFFVAVLRRQE